MKVKCLLGMGCMGIVPMASAIVVGQIDTFSDGTTALWGGGASPFVVSGGGPGGASDKYMRITSTGDFGPGSNLATNNSSQWAGNYTAVQVNSVELNLKNEGSVPLKIRAVLFNGLSKWTSTIPFDLPADNQWHHAVFSISAAAMTQVGGSLTFAQTAAAANQLMFRHNDPISGGGTTIASQLGLDNILASAGRRVAGAVSFSGIDPGAPLPNPVSIDFRNSTTHSVVKTVSATLAGFGDFNISAPPVPGVYELSTKVTHWLRRTVTVNTTSGDVAGAFLDMANGDVDVDNEVNLADYSALSTAFGSVPGDGNWNPQADLNDDGEVSLADYAILSLNFGNAGDD